MVFSFKTNTLANPILILHSSLFYLKEFYSTRIVYAPVIVCFLQSLFSINILSYWLLVLKNIFSLVYFHSVDIDIVYRLQQIEHRCRFDNDFELRWAEEPVFLNWRKPGKCRVPRWCTWISILFVTRERLRLVRIGFPFGDMFWIGCDNRMLVLIPMTIFKVM